MFGKKLFYVVVGVIIFAMMPKAFVGTVGSTLIGGDWNNASTWEGGGIPSISDGCRYSWKCFA